MESIIQLFRDSLPDAVGGVITAAILALVGLAYAYLEKKAMFWKFGVIILVFFLGISIIFRGKKNSQETTSLASDPFSVDISDYILPSEKNGTIPDNGSSIIYPTEPTEQDFTESTDLTEIGEELWRIDLPGQLNMSPLIGSDGSLYFVTSSGVLLSIDASSAENWKAVLGGASVTRNYTRPILDGDSYVYVVYDGELFKFSPEGTLDWTFSKPLSGSLTAQPAVGSDGTVYLMTNNSTLIAVSSDGNELWTQSLCQVMGGGTWPGPTVGTDGMVYGVCKGEDIYGLDPADGAIAWTYHTNDRMESTPIVGDNDLVYFASTGGWVIAMQSDGEPRWQTSVAGPPGYIQMIDAPLVRGLDGVIYVAPRHGTVFALAPQTGEIQWSAKIGGQGVGMNPVAVSMQGYVFARNLGGNLFYISADGEILWKISPISDDNNFSAPASGPQGELYLGIGEQLVAFQTNIK